MTISNQDEYKTNAGEIISIQLNENNKTWEVACWKSYDSCQWYKEYLNEEAARKEYNRWKNLK